MKKKCKIIYIISILIYFVINFYIYYKKLILKTTTGPISKAFYVLAALILYIIVFYLLYKCMTKKILKPEVFFAFTASIIGIIYLFATPIFKGPDEEFHWLKSYAVSRFEFLPERINSNGSYILCDKLPVSVDRLYKVQGDSKDITYKSEAKSMIYAEIAKYVAPENKIVETFNNPSAYYPFVQMLPQALGIIISRFIGLNVFFQAIFGRFVNLMLYILFGYFSIKLIPTKKYFLAAFLLCPKVMLISSTLSGDVFTNSVIILFISYIVYLMYVSKPLIKKDYIIITILVPLVAISKLVYLPVCLLLFLIPSKCFKDKKNKIYSVLVWLLLAAFVSLGWLKISSSYLFSAIGTSSGQIQFILNNPLKYLTILVSSFINDFSNLAIDMVGGSMEWSSELPQSKIVSYFVYLVFLLTLIIDSSKIKFKKVHKFTFLFVILSVIVLTETAIYVQWTSQYLGIGSEKIIGVQGRYFAPIAILFVLIFSFNKISKKINNNINQKIIYLCILLWQIPTLLNIIVRNI